LDEFRKEMDENGWEYGEDDEELMELAMHPPQYRNYKSGKAKADFEIELAEKKAAKVAKPAPAAAAAPVNTFVPKTLNVDVNGEKYVVSVSYGEGAPAPAAKSAENPAPAAPASTEGAEEIIAPLEGNYHRTKSAAENAIQVGDTIKDGDVIGYIESMKVYNAITADKSGKIVEICFNDGESVEEDDVLIKLQ
jgi:pyruvate carboxylase subunit B